MLAELYRVGGASGSVSELSDSELTSALSFACAAAAFSCTQPGAMSSLPDRDEVEELKRRSGEI
jgi:sugar/nucleoside kinase (ribokinase family)